MNKAARSIFLLLEASAYCAALLVVGAGLADGVAHKLPHSETLAALPPVAAFGILLAAGARWRRILVHPRTVLWTTIIVMASVHAASLPGFGNGGHYPHSPLFPLYYAVVIVFAATGNIAVLALNFLILFCTECVSLIGRTIVTFPVSFDQPQSVSFLLQRTQAALPPYGLIFGAALLAFAVARMRMNVNEGRTDSDDSDRKTGTPETTAPETVGLTMETAKTQKFTMEYISEIQNINLDTIDDLLSSVVYFMSRNFRAYSSLGFVFEPESRQFVLNSYFSHGGAVRRDVGIAVGKGIIGRIGTEKRSFMSGDLTYYNHDLYYYTTNEMILSILVVPIISDRKELLGALAIDSKDKNAFKEQHKELLKRFSALAAALITNVRMRLYQERAAKNFQTFYEASQQLGASLNSDAVTAVLFDMIGRAIPFARLVAVSFDPDRQSGAIVRVGGAAAELREGITFGINDGLYSTVCKTGEPISIGDFQAYQNHYYRFTPNEPQNQHIRSLIIAPVLDEKGVCRVAISAESATPNQYLGEIEQIVWTLTGNASVAFQRAQLYQKMERLATTDGLTQLCNHRFFQETLAREVERCERYGRYVSLLLMDIDHFKSFNDTYGHPIGDLVLKEISQCIRRAIRANDFPARYGGEEFAVIIPETNQQGAMAVAERIRSTVESHTVQSEKGDLHITLSIGCASIPDNAQTQPALIEAADNALYYSKEHGRNRTTLYKKGM